MITSAAIWKWSLFSEYWLEKHGDAVFQDYWAITELDTSMPGKQAEFDDGLYKQDQDDICKDSLASRCAPRHYLKFHRGAAEEEIWECKKSEEPWADPEQAVAPWWRSMNNSLDLA